MGNAALAHLSHPVERGSLFFYYRPRVEQLQVEDAGDIQRLLLLLVPSGSQFERVIAIGRKRLPRGGDGGRFWGFVDLVLAPADMQTALGPQVYGTRRRGLRHLPAARRFANGEYEIALHGEHAHLRWDVHDVDRSDPVSHEIALQPHGSYILTVANPDPAAWGLEEPPDLQAELFDELEIHVTVPSPFPPSMQRRFRQRRFLPVDSPEWLDHPGAELVFVNA